MASPQIENGYTRIANELLEALSRTNFSSYQRRVLDAILRKTYGYGKKVDRVSISQIAIMTGISRTHTQRTINELVHREIIKKSVAPRGHTSKLGINKNYSDWKDLRFSHNDTESVAPRGTGVAPRGSKVSPHGGPTKERKKLYCRNSDEFRLSELLLTLILERRNTFKKPDLQKWAKHIDLMIRIDKRKPIEIENIIRWCQADEFWQNNILSTKKLREQYDRLALKMQGNKSEEEQDAWSHIPNR